jgi:hypothetical protein
MGIPKGNVDDWYSHQELPPRDQWTGSAINPRVGFTGNHVGFDVFKKKELDFEKCEKCGGAGSYWAPRKRKQRWTKCDCKYATN